MNSTTSTLKESCSNQLSYWGENMTRSFYQLPTRPCQRLGSCPIPREFRSSSNTQHWLQALTADQEPTPEPVRLESDSQLQLSVHDNAEEHLLLDWLKRTDLTETSSYWTSFGFCCYSIIVTTFFVKVNSCLKKNRDTRIRTLGLWFPKPAL